MTIDAQSGRVAEVIGASRGSGYLIAPRLILTALHVVLGNEPPKDIPPDVSADIRLFGDVVDAIPYQDLGWDHAANLAQLTQMTLPWHGAKLVWPRAGTPSKATDIALLELTDPNATRIEPPSGLHIPFQPREEQCFASGFPSFRAPSSGDDGVWEFFQFKSAIDPSQRRITGARYVTISSMILPNDVEGWRGMSGAALWLDGGTALLGVVHALVDKIKLNNQLLYWPLDLIDPADPDFWRLTGFTPPQNAPARSIAATSSTKPLVAQLHENFFRFDRANFSEAFREWLCGDQPGEAPHYHRTGPPKKPAVIVLRGHRVDEPTLCAYRFADILAMEAWPDSAALYKTPVQLDCGPHALPSRGRLKTLMRQWAQGYSDQRLALDADMRAIITASLANAGRARSILIEHSQGVFGDGCREVLAGALAPLCDWKPAQDMPTTPPVMLLSILTGQDGGLPDRGFQPPVLFDGKRDHVDAALTQLVAATPEIEWFVDITDLGAELAYPGNVSEWLEEIEEIETPAKLPSDIGAEIELRLLPHLQFPIAFAREAVKAVINERRN